MAREHFLLGRLPQRGSMLAPVLAAALLAGSAAAQTRHARNAETGIESWQTAHEGVLVHLTQITPAQAQAFMLGRGLDAASARRYASTCVFMTIVRNLGVGVPVAYDLREWRARREGGAELSPGTREDWMREWEASGVPPAARIGFEWSQLPTTQRFALGDWNQGMTSYALPTGSRFDLLFEWSADGKTRRGRLEGARCADDDR